MSETLLLTAARKRTMSRSNAKGWKVARESGWSMHESAAWILLTCWIQRNSRQWPAITRTLNNLSVQDIASGLEREGQTWERPLWTTGGKLEFSKCLYYILFYIFDPDGTSSMESVTNMGDNLLSQVWHRASTQQPWAPGLLQCPPDSGNVVSSKWICEETVRRKFSKEQTIFPRSSQSTDVKHWCHASMPPPLTWQCTYQASRLALVQHWWIWIKNSTTTFRSRWCTPSSFQRWDTAPRPVAMWCLDRETIFALE